MQFKRELGVELDFEGNIKVFTVVRKKLIMGVRFPIAMINV